MTLRQREALEMGRRVRRLKAAGLKAKWHVNQLTGAPVLAARDPQARCPHQRRWWWRVDENLWRAMQVRGVRRAFDEHTLLGDFFHL